MNRLKALWGRVQQTRPWLVWQRYSKAQGNLLAGGVSYFAFFSVFPTVLLAFTAFGYLLRGQPELLADVKDALENALPGFIKSDANPNGIITVDAPSSTSLSVSGLVSVLGLIYTGTGWLSALRTAFQLILGVNAAATNLVIGKVRDLAMLVLLGVAFVASGALSAVAGTTARSLADLLGLGNVSWLLSGLTWVLSVLLDAAILALMLRILPGIRLPWSQLRAAALLGGLGLTVLKSLGRLLIESTLHNPLYASFAVVVGLLVWLNLVSRVTLLSAAWAGQVRADAEPGHDAMQEPVDQAQPRSPSPSPESSPESSSESSSESSPASSAGSSSPATPPARSGAATGAVLGAAVGFVTGRRVRGRG